MPIENIDPQQAKQRQDEGWQYVDVRSPQEFAQGHPVGAVNIPIAFLTPQGMRPNPQFMDAMTAQFPIETRLLLGCKSGGRSMRAAEMLVEAGYAHLANIHGGYSGAPDQAGWESLGLPCTTGA